MPDSFPSHFLPHPPLAITPLSGVLLKYRLPLSTGAKWTRKHRAGGNRKSSFDCQAKRGTQQASASRTVPPAAPRPSRGCSEESYSVWGAGRDQLTAIFLVAGWWGHWESASSTFWSQPLWGLCACGQKSVDFFHWSGLWPLRNSCKDMAQEYSLWSLKNRMSLTLLNGRIIITVFFFLYLFHFPD